MKKIAPGILLIIFVSIQFSFGRNILVCNDCQYSSIQAAIDIAQPGDTITVKGGFYQSPTLQIKKTLHIRGVDKPVLDGGGANEIVQIEAHNVIFEGFILQNTGLSYLQDRAAINIARSKNCVIRNNILKNTFFGLYFENSVKCTVENNEIFGEAMMENNSGNAIHMWYCDSMTVKNNKAYKHRDGIYLEFVKHSDIKNNISKGHLRYGLHFMFSDYNNYLENTFEDNGAGVAVMFSRHITMIRNKFRLNWGTASYGLLLKEIYDSNIEGNTFYQNTIGIYCESVTRCDIKNNDFERNGWAIKIQGSSMDNIISKNNFLSNTFDISTAAKRNSNTYVGNYWSSYSGYDLDHDGIGDVPYRPVKLFSYVVGEVDASVLLLRSFFIDMLDYAEKIMPSLTPADLIDQKPLMYKVK